MPQGVRQDSKHNVIYREGYDWSKRKQMVEICGSLED